MLRGFTWTEKYEEQGQMNTLQEKTYALLNSVQKFIETQGWLHLMFSICLRNQLNSFNSITVQISEKRDSSNRQ